MPVAQIFGARVVFVVSLALASGPGRPAPGGPARMSHGSYRTGLDPVLRAGPGLTARPGDSEAWAPPAGPAEPRSTGRDFGRGRGARLAGPRPAAPLPALISGRAPGPVLPRICDELELRWRAPSPAGARAPPAGRPSTVILLRGVRGRGALIRGAVCLGARRCGAAPGGGAGRRWVRTATRRAASPAAQGPLLRRRAFGGPTPH